MYLEWSLNGYVSEKGLFISAIIIIGTFTMLYVYVAPTVQNMKMSKNHIVISQSIFTIGKNEIPTFDIKKVIIEPHRHWMYLYLKNGKTLRYRKNADSMHLLQFQRCMDALGIEFGIIRRSGGGWKSRREVFWIKTMEDLRRERREERRRRWVAERGDGWK